ncbi:hypothetical protein B0J12DRAFT_157137 [Macrophomina phaseolina]|uniref:Uncharacterized protein n=1 Tax=Macrophomina phaseolina TaxID=35725 RepID=A0ABQ8GS38_9PEZI|nr:hypothetical protein B0J12DRAFT_157137 [Macrophomina phaseolina]
MAPKNPASRNSSQTNDAAAAAALPALEIDPAQPGTPVRLALVVESLGNLAFAVPFALNPAQTFRDFLLPDAAPPAAPSAEAAALARAYAVIVLGITAGMLLSVPSRAGAVEWRRMFYATSAATEIMYVPLLAWQAWGAGQGVAGTGCDPGKLVRLWALPMGVLLAWRAWVFVVKPGWFGSYRIAGRKGD